MSYTLLTCRSWFIAVVWVGMLALTGCDEGTKVSTDVPERPASAGEKQDARALRLSAEDARRAGIEVSRLELVDAPETVAAFGAIEPNRDRIARVVPPVDGRVVKVTANLGDQVDSGVALATLESPELGEVRAAYEQARTELRLAKAEFERTQSLVTEGSIARKEQLRANSAYEKAQAALNAAEAKLASLGVSKAAPAGGSPATVVITAPFAGTIIEKTAVLGEYGQAYKPLFTVADLSVLWLETDLYERDLGSVAVGASATLAVAAYPNERFTGTVTYISSTVDIETRTVKARVEIANTDGRLKPGMFADVLIDKAERRPVLRVPETALVLLNGQMTVFVAVGDGYEPRPVETGQRAAGQVVVRSGLEPGDKVVVAGAYALKARLLKSQIGDTD